jgi:hypothetical protein
LLSSALRTSARAGSTDLFQLLLFTGAMFAFLRGVEAKAVLPSSCCPCFCSASMNVQGPIALS